MIHFLLLFRVMVFMATRGLVLQSLILEMMELSLGMVT